MLCFLAYKGKFVSTKEAKSMQKLPNKVFPFIWHFLMQDKWRFFIALFFIAVIYAGIVYMGYTIKVLIDTITAYDKNTDFWSFISPALFVFIAIQSTIILSYRVTGILMPFIGSQLITRSVEETMAYVSQHSNRFFQDNQTGAVSNKLSTIGMSSRMIFSTFSFSIWGIICALLTSSFIFWQTSTELFIALWLYIALYSLFTVYTAKAKGIKKGEGLSKSRNEVMGNIVDTITNIITVKTFATEEIELERQKQKHITWRKYFKDNILFQEKERTLKAFLNFSMQLLALLLLAHAFQQEQITLGELVFTFGVVTTISRFAWELADTIIGMMEQIGQLQDALTLITQDIDIKDTKDAKPLKTTNGALSFKDCTFTYKGQQTAALNHLNLDIQPGEKIGIVGYSGAGKSTFVNLILRFFDVTSGSICIDGQDISKVTQQSLRSQIAYIPQEPMLFHRSIYDNIAYGQPNASKEDVLEASKKAQAHEFIEGLPDGYDSLVGERGVKLSGGQRQRIAIARAILKNAPLLILDEATSALDSVTEKSIQCALEKVMENRTSIVIAHRLSTLKNVDRILVLKDGEIIEQGKHNSLIRKKGGQYAKMWQLQSDGFLPEDSQS